MKSLILLVGVMCFGVAAFGQSEPAQSAQPRAAQRVAIDTNLGTIVIELDAEKAPVTVKSFLENVEAGIYDGSIFHRVIPGFMIQGGGFKPGVQAIETEKTLKNEADNGLKNLRGTVAMARRPDPDSASIQFFVNVVDNPALDHTGKSAQGWGYAVFGRVIEGMAIADAISKVPRGRSGSFSDVPSTDVVIKSAKRTAAPVPADG